MTSYQKLKQKNKELQQDIYNLVMDMDGEGRRVKFQYYHLFSTAKMMCFGEINISKGDGLISQMEKVEYDFKENMDDFTKNEDGSER